MNRHHFLLSLLVAGIGAGVTGLTAGTLLLSVWWVIAPGLAVGAVVAGIRRHRPVQPRPWWVLVAALALLWIGWCLSALVATELVGAATTRSLGWLRDIVYLVAYPVLGVASLFMARARTGGRDRDNLIDALVVMVATVIVLGAWLLGPRMAGGIAGTDRVWVLVAPVLLAAVLSASSRVVFAGGQRVPAAWLLLVASVVTLIGNAWTVALIRDGSPTQSTGVDMLWVVGFVAVGSAALHPSMRVLTQTLPAENAVRGMPTDRLWLLGVAMGAVPLAHLRVSGGSAHSIGIAGGGVLMVLLVMWRMHRLLHDRDLARRAAAATADHDAIMLTVGRWALEDLSTQQLLTATDSLLTEALPGRGHRVLTADSADPGVGDVGGDPSTHYLVSVADESVARIVAGDGRRDDPAEHTFLEAIAALLSAAVQRRAAEARLLHDSLHDKLTGLPNRTLAMDRLAQLLRDRGRAAVSVVFLDLDGFKQVNDTCGHAAGDRVLCDVASRLLAAVREADTVARLAGDEFAVLVPCSGPTMMESLVERLRDAVTFTVNAPGGRRLQVDASIGVSFSATDEVGPEALMHLADMAMYSAKQDGSGIAWADQEFAAC